MDVEEFVASTIEQIAKGVRRAQSAAADDEAPGAQSGWISPAGSHLPELEGTKTIGMGNGDAYLQSIHFDLAVTVSTKSEGGGQAGVKVLEVVSGSIGKKTASENTAASRVRFQVPVVLPGQSLSERERTIKANWDKALTRVSRG